MNKATLISKVAEKTGTTKAEATAAVEAVLSTIKESVVTDSVQLIGFGVFKSTIRTARVGRNPQTGQPINIPEKNVVKFKPYF